MCGLGDDGGDVGWVERGMLFYAKFVVELKSDRIQLCRLSAYEGTTASERD